MRLENKVVVITGAASGMGRQMAELFVKEGAKVFATDWHAESLDAAIAEVSALGGPGQIAGLQGNVAVKEDCERVIDAAVSAFGGLDVLCNNAGVMDLFQGVAQLDDDVYERVMAINADGPMFMSRKAIPIMIEGGGGSIINTASAAGIGGGAAGTAYTMSKHALVGLTRSIAYRYALEGIRCNAMACGGVKTNIMQSIDPTKLDQGGAARYGAYQALIPVMLEAEEIANLALFLASPESKHVNGAIIPIDGGWTAA